MFPALSSTQQETALVVGFFLPLLLAIPIQEKWSDPVKAVFSVCAYAVAGAVTAVVAGTLTGKTWWQCSLEILALGVLGYQGVWKPTNLAPVIQNGTTIPILNRRSQSAAPAAAQPNLAPEVASMLTAAKRLLDQAAARLSQATTTAPNRDAAEMLSERGTTARAEARGGTDGDATAEGSPDTWVSGRRV